jgi:amino acid adenylation domain-containing protein/thioester reductase-like protein
VSSEATDFTRRRLAISAELADALEQRADEEGAERESIFVAALVALLVRYSGRDDVSLEVAARGQAWRVQLRLDADPDAWQLFGRTALALSHSAGRDPGDSTDSPPSEVRTEQVLPGAVGGVRVLTRLDRSTPFGDADLVVDVEPHALDLHFRSTRFEDQAPARIAEHLRALVEGLARATGPVSAIPLVHGEERAWVLAQSNAANIDLEERLPDVMECFEEQVRSAPQAIALVDGPRQFSYRELDAAANALCDALRARGVGSGVHVVTYLERGAEAIIAFLGILKARGTYVPVDTSYPAARVAVILASARPRLVLTSASHAVALGALSTAEMPLALFFMESLQSSASARARPEVRVDDPAYLFFTSGSTGRPKGVIVDHRALGNYVRAARQAYGVTSRDRLLQAASLGFDLSLEEILITLTAGAALVVRSAGPIESVQAFFAECLAQRLTVLSITSALWHELTLRIADGSAQLPPGIRLVILGADVARPDILPIWQRATRGQVRLVNSYGLTETAIVATVWEASDAPLSGEWRALPIGRPLRNVSVYVLDAKGELAPVGISGEICIGGRAVARGYLDDEELTRSRFVRDPYVPGGWMYRSGDQGVLRSSGQLEFLGRADFRVKVQGVRVELGEIEARLREVRGVVEAVVVARSNPAGETQLDAYVMSSSSEVTSTGLRAHLEAVLPLAVVPTRIHVVERLPLTAAGKLHRRALAAAPPDSTRTPFIAPRTPLEKLVASTLAEVLGLEGVGLHDGFLALGGTSLSAVRAASVLGPRLGRRVAAQLFLECPTLGDICAAVARPASGSFDWLHPLRALQADALLASEIAPHRALPPHEGPLESVLLTGATGFFGAFVLAELLRNTRARVVCLVRAPSLESARARIATALSQRGCSVASDVLGARVSYVCGDIARPWLDLTPDGFQGLSADVDTIIHAAARVSMLLPYETLRASNAVGLQWVLRLAMMGRPKTLHHVSTVDVLADTDPSEPDALAERPAGASPALLTGGYGQSKWVAEKLVERARARGIQAKIYRPGRLMGHSANGAFNDNDFLVQLLDACGRIGTAPVLDVQVDITPVDAAAAALVRLASVGSDRHVLHLVHPQTLSWGELIETAIAQGYPLRLVPHARWSSALQELAAADEQTTFLEYLAGLSSAEIEASLRGGYAVDATRAALGRDFEWPPIDARLIATYLRAMSDAGRFWIGPRPRSSVSPLSSRSSSRLAASK